MFKTEKRLAAFLLCLAIILPLIPSSVFAAVSTPGGMIAAEAENRFVAFWNRFSNVEGNGTRSDCSGGSMVGNGSHGKNIAYEDLKKDADLSQTAYVRWTVEAPEDGDYNISLRYLMYTSAIANNESFTSTPYAAFLVNGQTAYRANFQGKNKWVSNTDNVAVALKKGANEIVAIPLVQDVITALGGNCYANVDCLYVQNSLKIVKNLVEAENTDYAVWNGYKNTENNSNASGGVQVGGSDASRNVYFADLKEGVDLSNTAYVKWTVNAPDAGNYEIALREHVQIGGSHSGSLKDKVYVSFFVNGKDAYKAKFNGENKWVYDTDSVSVALEKGNNEIIAIPLVKDIIDAYSWGWANVDCLYLDSRLTPKLPEPPAVLVKAEAEDTIYAQWNRYSTLENRSDASGGVIVGGGINDSNVLYSQLVSGVDLSNTAYVKWTVRAPESGDYAIALRYLMKAGPLGSGDALDSGAYAAFFVNGQTAYKAKFLGKNNWVYETENIEVALNKGTNEIIAIPFVKDLLDSYGHGWANVDCLWLEDQLTLVKNVKAEAEDTVHAGWNNYTAVESNGNASSGKLVGGGDASKNVYYADLVSGVDLSETSYVKWTLNAPADGEYTVALRYSMKIGKLVNDATVDAYAAFFVNGEAAVKAKFLGKNNWVYDTENVKLTLQKGYNQVIVIPMVKDITDALGGGWANVDCLYLDSRLTVGTNRVEAEDTAHTAWHGYSQTENNANASGGVLVGGGDASKNPYFAQLGADVRLGESSYMKWAVNAPKAGEYSLGLRYAMKGGNQENNGNFIPEAYATFLINGTDVYKAEFLGKNSWVYDTQTISVLLQEGYNEIIAVPVVKDLVESYNWAWANVDCLYLDGQLTVLDAPQITDDGPLHLTLEAEDTVYTQWNSYNKTEAHDSASGGMQAAGSAANKNVYYADLKEGVELYSTAYVKWVFDAPKDGAYTFSLRYSPNAETIKAGEAFNPKAYAAFFVNGKDAYQAAFLGYDSWVYDTEYITVQLQQGLNEVVAIPVVKDLYDAWGGGWANVDCLHYDSRLTPQKAPVKITVEAEDRKLTHWNGYNTQESHNSASGGMQAAGSSAQNNVYYKQLKKGVNLTYTSYVKWVITAPQEGDYTFSLRYSPNADNIKSGKALNPEGYAAFFVNGQDAYKATFLGYDNWVYNTKEISVHLKEGDNEIVVIPMVKDLYDAWGGGWANVDCLYMEEGLTVKPTGYVPDYRKTVEAEDLEYVQWNLYNTTENHSSATNKKVAAGSDAAANIYLKDLVPGADLSGTAYLKWTVIAPADGNYSFGLRYAAKADGIKTGDAYTKGNAYATFFVNDSDVYKAALTGFGARCNWLWDTQNVSIKLKKGENEIYVIPMIKDLYDAWGGGWANVDCLKMDPRLSLKKAPAYTRFEAEYSEYNLYEGFATRVGTEDWGSAWENDVTFDNLNEETIVAISHVKYYVSAEKAGTYRIGIGFRQGHNLKEYKDAFFGLSVNLQEKYKVPFTATNAGNNRLVYVDVELKEGDNYIYVTACMKDTMDYPQFPSQKNGYVLWIDHDYILLPEGLTSTVASAQPNWTGDSEADYNQSLLSVWGDLTGGTKTPQQQPAQVNEWGWIAGIGGAALAGLLLAVLLVIVIILFAKRKRKQ